jgi:hypothetical protein
MANPDFIHVATDHRHGPDGTIFAHDYIAYNQCSGIHIGIIAQGGECFIEFPNRHSVSVNAM